MALPFSPEMSACALGKLKCLTTRSDNYGVDNIFPISDEHGPEPFITRYVEKLPLWYVAQELYWHEGFVNPQSFVAFWNKLHPKKQFLDEPEAVKHVHYFRPVVEHLEFRPELFTPESMEKYANPPVIQK